MTDTYQPTAEPAAAPPPPIQVDVPPGAPVGPVPGVASSYSGESYESDGRTPKIHQDPRTAGLELARRRSEVPKPPQDFLEGYQEEIKYIDGRDPDAEVDVKDAAADLGQYRRDRNQQLQAVLDEIEGRTAPAAAAAEGAQPGEVEGQAQQPAESGIDEYAAAIAAHAPELKAAISQIDEALIKRSEYADILRSWGEDVPVAPGEAHVQQAQQQAHAITQAAEFERQKYALGVLAQLGLSQQEIQQYADLARASPEELARISAQDPQRVARAQQVFQKYRTYEVEVARLIEQHQQAAAYEQAQQQHAYAARFQKWAIEQDRIAEKLVPELSASADKQTQVALQKATAETLRDAGFQDAEVAQAWHNGQGINLRDARVQKVLAKAAKFDLAMQKALTAQKKAVPPVQRPGVAMDRATYREAEMQQKFRDLDGASGTQQLKLGAALLAARRAAR